MLLVYTKISDVVCECAPSQSLFEHADAMPVRATNAIQRSQFTSNRRSYNVRSQTKQQQQQKMVIDSLGRRLPGKEEMHFFLRSCCCLITLQCRQVWSRGGRDAEQLLSSLRLIGCPARIIT